MPIDISKVAVIYCSVHHKNTKKLIDAISDPFDNSGNALAALLETEFSHYLDPPSLALIIPILDYNLKSQNKLLIVK